VSRVFLLVWCSDAQVVSYERITPLVVEDLPLGNRPIQVNRCIWVGPIGVEVYIQT